MDQSWSPVEMLDKYIHDYLVKRNLHVAARFFRDEGNILPEPVELDNPEGFLLEWWSFIWDIYSARMKEKNSDAAASHTECFDDASTRCSKVGSDCVMDYTSQFTTHEGLDQPPLGIIQEQMSFMQMLQNDRNIVLGEEGRSISIGDLTPNGGSPQTTCPVLLHADTNMLNTVAQMQHQQQQLRGEFPKPAGRGRKHR